MSRDSGELEAALARVREGDREAYASVVLALEGRLRAALAAWCPPGVEPDEIAHRAFVEAYRGIRRYEPGTRFEAWLHGIARTLLLEELRRNRRESERTRRYLDRVVADAVETELEGVSEIGDARMRALRDCMAGLTAESREIVEMRYASETPLQSIARRIGKSLPAVKFQLFDIRRRLRQCVNGKLSTEGA